MFKWPRRITQVLVRRALKPRLGQQFVLFLLVTLCLIGCLTTSCVTNIPVDQYVLARAAYDAARDADSARYAPGLWYKAEEAYKRGQRQFKERDYSAATETFDEARYIAERAENAARLARDQAGGVPP